MQIISVLVLLLSWADEIKADIDYNVCNPLTLKPVPPPPPALPMSYSTKLEWKWVERNETISVTEVHDGINKIGSQTIHRLGQTTQVIYDYDEHQYIVYNQTKGCTATGLGSFAFYDDKIWLTSTKMLYHLAREGTPPHIGTTVVRNLTVGHWMMCLDIFQSNITVEIDMYFSVPGWGMAISTPNQMVPVRFEMKGSHNYRNDSNDEATYFHVIGDFIDFNPNPPSNLDPLQPPPGVFCTGRKSRKPMNPLPSSFSLIMEKIDMDYFKISYESVWFHAQKKLVRRDYKEARGSDPDPTMDILDYNLGVHYNIDAYTVSCEVTSAITVQDLYAKAHGDNTVVMQSALDFFHIFNTNIQYVGTRTVRGVACDVWVGVYLDVESARNDTIEWYFTKDNWVEAVDLAIQPAALIRMDIWQGGSNKPIVHNVYHLNPVAPPIEVFNVAPCYKATQKRRVLIPFKVSNDGNVDKVSARYLKDTLHDVITTKTFIDPLRLTEIQLEFQGPSKVYMAATLLDRPPLTSRYLFPQPSPSSSLHDLSETYFFLNGLVNQPLSLNISSTVGNKPVSIEAIGLFNIDYSSDSSSTTSTTTLSTTEATPPPPTKAPTTTKQIIPTPGTAELKTTTTTLATSTLTTNTATSPAKQATCTCPKVTCPTTNPPTTAQPVTCPTPSPPTPCPTNNVSISPTNQPSASSKTHSERSTKSTCICPKLSCPTVTPQTTASPVNCPTPALPTPCPTSHVSSLVTKQPLKSLPTQSGQSGCTCPNTTCPKMSQQTTATPVSCPTPTPCPTSKVSNFVRKLSSTSTKLFSTRSARLTYSSVKHSPIVSQSSPSFSRDPTTTKYLKYNGKDPDSKGISGGVAAAVAIVTLVIGLVFGVVALKLFQNFRRNSSGEGKNILTKYLDDDLKY